VSLRQKIAKVSYADGSEVEALDKTKISRFRVQIVSREKATAPSQ
jgi:hypothetical protein